MDTFEQFQSRCFSGMRFRSKKIFKDVCSIANFCLSMSYYDIGSLGMKVGSCSMILTHMCLLFDINLNLNLRCSTGSLSFQYRAGAWELG